MWVVNGVRVPSAASTTRPPRGSRRPFECFEQHADKDYSFVDCLSFVILAGCRTATTLHGQPFVQYGYTDGLLSSITRGTHTCALGFEPATRRYALGHPNEGVAQAPPSRAASRARWRRWGSETGHARARSKARAASRLRPACRRSSARAAWKGA